MKKLMIFAACTMLAAVTHAAAVGWSLAGATAYAGDAYQFFVIGQNGVSSIATVTALLDAGTSAASYAFGSGAVGSNGAANTAFSSSGKTLGAGTYEAFYVIFDSAELTAGSTKYAVVSGAAQLTKEVTASAASVTFVAGNQSTYLNNSDNWKAFGSATPTPGPGPDPSDVPEPTTGMLVLLGVAGLALRRRA